MTTTTNEIVTRARNLEVTGTTIEWSENADLECKRYPSFKEARRAILRASHSAPVDGCYDKTKFVVHFNDGTTYTGRIDLKAPSAEGSSFADHCLLTHVGEFVDYVTSERAHPAYRKTGADAIWMKLMLNAIRRNCV